MTTYDNERPAEDIVIELLSLDGDDADDARVEMGELAGNDFVDGSTTPVNFEFPVPGDRRFLWTRTNILFIASTPNAEKFGNLAKLDNGCLLQEINPDGSVRRTWNRRFPIRQNGDWMLLAGTDNTHEFAAGAGSAGARWTVEKAGSKVWVPPGGRIRLVIQDDLDGLDSFRVCIQGQLYTSDE